MSIFKKIITILLIICLITLALPQINVSKAAFAEALYNKDGYTVGLTLEMQKYVQRYIRAYLQAGHKLGEETGEYPWSYEADIHRR